MTNEAENSTSADGPGWMLKASYLLLAIVAMCAAIQQIFFSEEPDSAVGIRVILAVGVPSLALLCWPWPKDRVRVFHIARVVSSVAFGSTLFILPILIDRVDEYGKLVNVGLLSVALFLHGSIVLIAAEYLRRVNEKDQRDLHATCRDVLHRMEQLEGRLEVRDQSLATEMRAVATAVDRLEHQGWAKKSWIGRLRQRL